MSIIAKFVTDDHIPYQIVYQSRRGFLSAVTRTKKSTFLEAFDNRTCETIKGMKGISLYRKKT